MSQTAINAVVDQTGHPGIDEQHQQLVALVARLDLICTDHENVAAECAHCPDLYRQICVDRLAGLIGELLGFMVEHFRYEEELMRLLEPTDKAQRHIQAHKRAHAEVSSQLSELTFSLDTSEPRACAQRLQKILDGWIGGHNQTHDSQLAGALEAAFGHEVDYDLELVRLMADVA